MQYFQSKLSERTQPTNQANKKQNTTPWKCRLVLSVTSGQLLPGLCHLYQDCLRPNAMVSPLRWGQESPQSLLRDARALTSCPLSSFPVLVLWADPVPGWARWGPLLLWVLPGGTGRFLITPQHEASGMMNLVLTLPRAPHEAFPKETLYNKWR